MENYRNILTLKTGDRIVLRPLSSNDREGLIAMFSTATKEETLFLKHNVHNEELVSSWVDDLNYDRVFPLLATSFTGEILGNATLHFREGVLRHTAELRIFISGDYRGKGLGSVMIKELLKLARRKGAQIVADQMQVVKAFRKLGFVRLCDVDGYFLRSDGVYQDVVLMLNYLKEIKDFEF